MHNLCFWVDLTNRLLFKLIREFKPIATAGAVTVIWVSPCFGYPHPRVPSRDTQNPSDLGTPSQMRVEFSEHLLKFHIAKQCVELGLQRQFLPLGISSLRKEIEPMCLALLCIKSFPCVISVQTNVKLSG